jgi:hypothetical protein
MGGGSIDSLLGWRLALHLKHEEKEDAFASCRALTEKTVPSKCKCKHRQTVSNITEHAPKDLENTKIKNA